VKVIFISGPYRGRRLANILRARAAARFVWEHGGVALCPHMNTAFFDRWAPDAVWIQGGLELLSRCDALWAIEGWETSAGARIEVGEAERLEMPRLWSHEDVLNYLGAAVTESGASAQAP
jgi:hypothetical protein